MRPKLLALATLLGLLAFLTWPTAPTGEALVASSDEAAGASGALASELLAVGLAAAALAAFLQGFRPERTERRALAKDS